MSTVLSTTTAAPATRLTVADEIARIFDAVSINRAGTVADYIPELGTADPDLFGLALATVDGASYSAGDASHAFTIQSVSKPFTFGMALEDRGRDGVLARVGVEPTGDTFNSIAVDEASRRPFNPMVNAGAIVTTGLLEGKDPTERLSRMQQFLSRFAGRSLQIDENVFESERSTGDRNRAIGYLMRGFGMLDRVDEVLDLYFRQCSLLVTSSDLAMMAATLANGGVNPSTGVRALSTKLVENVLSVMATCGMYDFSGEWLYTVGLPAKSGVSGGVIAVLPGQFGVGVFSPRLDTRGNSVRGVAVCQEISRRFDLHQYRPGLLSTDAVGRRLQGGAVRCRRSLPAQADRLLDREGWRIAVYELRGNLTFGSTERFVRQAVEEMDEIEWLILDFRRVGGVDPVSWRLIEALVERAEELGKRAVISHATEPPPGFTTAADTEEALQICEDELLGRLGGLEETTAVSLRDQPLIAELDEALIDAIETAARRLSLSPGEVVFHRGDDADAIYFISSGSLCAQVEVEAGSRVRRLQTMGPGVAFGEMGLLDDGPRSASVVVEDPAVVYALPFAEVRRLEADHPGVSAALYRSIGRMLAGRLRRATEQIQALDR